MEDIAEATDFDLRTVARTLKSLAEAKFISGTDVTTWGDDLPVRFMNLELREKGRRSVGQWPEGAAEAFIAALPRLVVEEDPEERSRLAKLRDDAKDVFKGTCPGSSSPPPKRP